MDYGRQAHVLHLDDPNLAVFDAPSLTLGLSATVAMDRTQDDVTGEFVLTEAEMRRSCSPGSPKAPRRARAVDVPPSGVEAGVHHRGRATG